jgi:hypothetical protein
VNWFTRRKNSGRNAAIFLFKRQGLRMFFAEDKYKADVVDKCEDADVEDFDFYINGNLDTRLYYQHETVDEPSELYYELQEKHQQRQTEEDLERAYD